MILYLGGQLEHVEANLAQLSPLLVVDRVRLPAFQVAVLRRLGTLLSDAPEATKDNYHNS